MKTINPDNPEKKKQEEYTKVHHNQIAEKRRLKENLKGRAKRHIRYSRLFVRNNASQQERTSQIQITKIKCKEKKKKNNNNNKKTREPKSRRTISNGILYA